MFFSRKKEETFDPIVINITIGSVEIPTADEYKQLRNDPTIHRIILKILDHRISNTYKSMWEWKLSNEDLQSLNGTLRWLVDLRALIK